MEHSQSVIGAPRAWTPQMLPALGHVMFYELREAVHAEIDSALAWVHDHK